MSVTFLCVFVGTTLLSFLLTRSVRNVANARGWVYAPPSTRHIHTEAVPRLGGVAIFITVAIIAAILYAFPGLPNIEPAVSRRVILYILAPATLVFLLGLFDDFRPVKPWVKFLVQALAATILFAGGFGVFHLPLLFGSYDFGWLALPL